MKVKVGKNKRGKYVKIGRKIVYYELVPGMIEKDIILNIVRKVGKMSMSEAKEVLQENKKKEVDIFDYIGPKSAMRFPKVPYRSTRVQLATIRKAEFDRAKQRAEQLEREAKSAREKVDEIERKSKEALKLGEEAKEKVARARQNALRQKILRYEEKLADAEEFVRIYTLKLSTEKELKKPFTEEEIKQFKKMKTAKKEDLFERLYPRLKAGDITEDMKDVYQVYKNSADHFKVDKISKELEQLKKLQERIKEKAKAKEEGKEQPSPAAAPIIEEKKAEEEKAEEKKAEPEEEEEEEEEEEGEKKEKAEEDDEDEEEFSGGSKFRLGVQGPLQPVGYGKPESSDNSPLSDSEIEDLMKGVDGFLGAICIDEIGPLVPRMIAEYKLGKISGFITLDIPRKLAIGQHKSGIYRRPAMTGHWVAVALEPEGPSLLYYDSFGEPCPKDMRFELKKIADKTNTLVKFKENRVKEQSANTDNCGWFCIKFLTDTFRRVPFVEATGFNALAEDVSEKEIEKFKEEFKPFGWL